MLPRAFLLALPAVLAAGLAHAADGKKAKEVGQYVDVSPVAAPVVTPDGRLVNYVFVTVRLGLASGADAASLRAKEPFFRDALVRAAHRTPFTSQDSYAKVDEARLKAAMKREAAAIAGAKTITAVTIVSQAPKRSTGLPAPIRARSAELQR